jgi:hypothetical protein
MNTTSHAIINLAILGKTSTWKQPWIIITGAILPDVMMFVFFAIHQFILKTPQRQIWNTEYFKPIWQHIFDVFNSIPLLLLVLIIAYKQKWQTLKLLCYSMLLHVTLDLPVHREDAHHHFWPLSDYQFISPVSYWDPAFYGLQFSIFEILLTLMLSIYCYKNIDSKLIKIGIVIINVLAIIMIGLWIIVFI